MHHVIFNQGRRYFAVCQSCYWTATFFTRIENYECPFCPGKNVELIPLNLDEKYEYDLQPNKGLEIKFSRF